MAERHIPEMTLKNLQDFAIVNIAEYKKFMQGRKHQRSLSARPLKRKKR